MSAGTAARSSASARVVAAGSPSAGRGATRNPVYPGSTRSRGPPTSGATTGSPDASASGTAWQNVSAGPVCTNTSSEA